MLIAESSTMQLLPFRTLTLDVFYGSPVILEDVGDEHFLGFDIDSRNRTISFIQPKSQWQIRHYAGAGSKALKLSGIKSRLVLLRRNVWPKNHCEQQVQQFKHQLYSWGFDPADVAPL